MTMGFLRIPLPLRHRTCSSRLNTPRCSLSNVAKRVLARETTAEAEVTASLEKIAAQDDTYRAFISVDGEGALRRAREIDAAVGRGESPGALAGVPIAVKDNICVRGSVTTAGSRILDGFVSSYSATVVRRLVEAGAVIVGKTNMDEFGMGSSTENSAFFVTKNPVNTERVPGGSSGGSAAAVVADMVPVALGSDTGGSIRLPASYCGCVGFKPSYGRVSRSGLIAYASSLDTIGPLTKSVREAAEVLQIIAGGDGMDATSADAPVCDYVGALRKRLDGVVVGVVEDAFDFVDDGVAAAMKKAVETLRELGAKTRTVSLRSMQAATAAYYVLATSEASANLARYDGIRYGARATGVETAREVYTSSRGEGLGDEVKRRIMLGTYALSSGYYDAYYEKAQRVRESVRREFASIFEGGVQVLVKPVAPTTAFRIGEKTVDQTKMYADDRLNVPASLAGLPACSVPCGEVEGLPVGLQVVGPYLGEEIVLGVSHAFQVAGVGCEPELAAATAL